MMKTLRQEFTKGLWEQIPPFRLVLGLCPTLAVTKSLEGGWGMGLATTFVLVCSNVLVSALRKAVPPKVRIATFILIIATFVVITELMMKAYTPLLSDTLGVFIPLIVVNCLILGRAEAFASKIGVGRSLLDGMGMGLGFTISLTVLASIRELLGTGKLTVFSQADLSATIIPLSEGREYLFKFMVDPAGAFVCLGAMVMLMNILGERSKKTAETSRGS
ncbi:MAG: electron transport complex subunit E [Proteobacteria bacterium]|nr:electron transport complex subunit E [Pseudomonadota bacterium]